MIQLNAGYPVVVGVHHKYNNKENDDHTTDHFVVIVGRGCDNGKKWYLFYEVGTDYNYKGMSDQNKLHQVADGFLNGSPVYNTEKNYVVTQIRRNIK